MCGLVSTRAHSKGVARALASQPPRLVALQRSRPPHNPGRGLGRDRETFARFSAPVRREPARPVMTTRLRETRGRVATHANNGVESENAAEVSRRRLA